MSSHHDWVNDTVQRHDLDRPFAPENGQKLKFQVGDSVVYTNDYGATFNRKITGLYKHQNPCSLYAGGYRYLLDKDSYWMPVKEASLRMNERATALEELQALGFDSEDDYAEHQRMLAKADELYKLQSLLVADGDWCLLHPIRKISWQ